MTLNTMLYSYMNKEERYEGIEDIEILPINDFRDDDDPLKIIKEQVTNEQPVEVQDPCYIRWQIFDDIPERVYTIKHEGYFDKNGKPLDDETSIEHLTNGESPIEICSEIEHYDENGDTEQ